MKKIQNDQIFLLITILTVCVLPSLQGQLITQKHVNDISAGPRGTGQNEPVSKATRSDHMKQGPLEILNPGPDLEIDWYYHSYNYPNLTYFFRIKNTGTSPSGAFRVGFYLAHSNFIVQDLSVFMAEYEHPALAAGGIGPDDGVTVNVAGYPGTWYPAVFVDYKNNVIEDNENNNKRWSGASIDVPAPDLIITKIDVTDGDGPDIGYKLTVKNIGAGMTDGSKIKTRIYLSSDNVITADDYLVDDWNFTDVLASDASKTSWDMTSSVTGVPAGDYFLGAVTDANNLIAESDETNNTAYDPDPKVTIPGGGTPPPVSPPVILDVPRAKIPPVIDGNMDPVWYGVCSVPMEKQNTTDAAVPQNWLDSYASFRMMYDSDYLYLFMQAYDDLIRTSNANAYENDSFELFFDGDNSKNSKATGYDANDRQIRYVYGQTTENTGNAPHSICRFADTDLGFNLEVRIHALDLTFPLTPDHIFGFEIQCNDNDTGGRNHLLKWWNASNDSWLDPSLFGTAVFTDYVAASPAYILRAPGTPVIDGSADDAAWNGIPWFSDNTFMKTNLGGSTDPPFDIHTPDDWNDCRFNWKMMWQGSMLYFYADVYDNAIRTSNPDPWRNDCIEIFIDGNNDKGPNTDSNDHAYSYVFSGTPTADDAFTETAYGWTLETRMNMATDMGITPSAGHLMGFDVKLNDNDTGARDLMSAWWSSDDGVWSSPNLRGTLKLAGFTVDLTDAAETAGNPAPDAFHLAQNYPNPFNPSTTILYSVPISCFVTLTVYDLLGREISALVNESTTPGEYSAVWNGQNHPTGIYLIRFTAGEFSETRKLILQK
ncbi:T9SS type A sorting domain-containing protein [bacterium]|nr:T9SS type A sorting domain-containing protein [bacterium]